MSLPLSPNTAYLAGNPPTIKAADLNALQQYLAGLYSAGYTVKSLVADGTGGNATSSPTPGTVAVSSSVATFTTTPPFAMPTVPIGQLNREQILLGAVRCSTLGGSVSQCGGFNVASVERTAIGNYLVTFNNAFPTLENHVPLVTVFPNAFVAPIAFGVVASTIIVAGQYRVGVRVWDVSGGTTTDPLLFSLVVVGG